MTVQESKRLAASAPPAQSVAFIWSGGRTPPETSNLPALGAAPLTIPRSQFFAAANSEFRALGEAAGAKLKADPRLRQPQNEVLGTDIPTHVLEKEIKAVPSANGIVVLTPIRIVSFCAPGCYQFKLRAEYLAATSRAPVWTAVLDVPPKSNHYKPWDEIGAEFALMLAAQLAKEGLLPR